MDREPVIQAYFESYFFEFGDVFISLTCVLGVCVCLFVCMCMNVYMWNTNAAMERGRKDVRVLARGLGLESAVGPG